MHFINGFNQIFDANSDIIDKKYKEIRTFINSKKEGDFDNADMLRLKGLIRRGEARTACTYAGIKSDSCSFP